MPRPLILIYVIVTATIALCTTVLEIQPALFFIDLMAPNPGDRYSVPLVMLIICLTLLLPLMVLMLITKAIRMKSTENIGSDRTGIFVTRQKSFQSALVGIPIYLNSKKVGIVDNGKTKFFDVPLGDFTVQAGKGKQASEKLQAKVAEKDQLNFLFNLNQAGLFVKIELTEIAKD